MTDYELAKIILGEGETGKLQNRFDIFKGGLCDVINKDINDNRDGSGGLGRGVGGIMMTVLHQDFHHRQIYLTETLRQKIQDGLHKLMNKNFKIED